MYEAFYAKLQLRETFIIIPQKPDLHQKFGAIVMELSFSHGAKKRSGKRSRSKMTGYAEIYPPKIKSNKIKKSPRSLRALYGHGLLLLLLGGFFAVALKFFAGHDIDDTEIDIAHFKAGHFLDLATDIDLDAVEDGRRRRAVFKDGFDLDGRCCTVNGSGDALGGFGGGAKAGRKSAHERSFHVEDAVDVAAGNAGDLFDDGIVNDEGVVVLWRDGCLWLFAHTIRSFLINRERDAIIS